MILILFFWFFLSVIIYSYFGYTLLLGIIALIKRIFLKETKRKSSTNYEPEVSLLIPSYNEGPYVTEKVNNCMELDYPKHKLKIIWITDGSDDDTLNILSYYPPITVLHENERRGKIHAMNRGMSIVNTPIAIFSDANSMLNKKAIREIVKEFINEKTGCVTGEKRITNTEKAAGAGEGLYWKYESLIKKLESETGSVVGAIGEIFGIRTSLYEEVTEDTLLDDFILSIKILQKGFRIKYTPLAWASETSSQSVSEEIKRKIRIASGGIQSFLRLLPLLNPFKYGFFSIKYLSHKVLRWTIVPVSFIIVFFINLLLVLISPFNTPLYELFFIIQCLFYLLVILGKIIENKKTGFGLIFAPYYLFIMNYAVFLGNIMYFTGKYSVNWQKVKRSGKQ